MFYRILKSEKITLTLGRIPIFSSEICERRCVLNRNNIVLLKDKTWKLVWQRKVHQCYNIQKTDAHMQASVHTQGRVK